MIFLQNLLEVPTTPLAMLAFVVSVLLFALGYLYRKKELQAQLYVTDLKETIKVLTEVQRSLQTIEHDRDLDESTSSQERKAAIERHHEIKGILLTIGKEIHVLATKVKEFK